VEHKPLAPILNDYALDKLDNPRLLRLGLKIQRYAFTARWIPGKKNMDADALSRAPSSNPTTKDELAERPVSFTVRNKILAIIGRSDVMTLDPVLEKVEAAAAADPTMMELRHLIRDGFPSDKCNLSAAMRPYWYGRRWRSDSHPEKPAPTHSTRPAPDAPRSKQTTPTSPPDSFLAKHIYRHHQRHQKLQRVYKQTAMTLRRDRLSRHTPTSAPSTDAISWSSWTSSAIGRMCSRCRTATRPPAASSTPSGATSQASGHRSSFRATTAATSPELGSRSSCETGESPTGSHPLTSHSPTE